MADHSAALVSAVPAAPAVVSVTPSVPTVTSADVAGSFHLTVAFNETMDQAVFPTISFPTPGQDPTVHTLVNPTGAWLDAQTFQETYVVADSQELLTNISVEVVGGRSTTGLFQTPAVVLNVFAVDTLPPPPPTPPSVLSVTPSAATITDANVGNGTFTLQVIFNDTMNTAIFPTITFPASGEDPTVHTLFNPRGTWLNSSTFQETFDVQDSEEVLPNIDVQVSGARDTLGILQSMALIPNDFVVDTVEPTVHVSTASGGSKFLSGQPVSFIFTATDASPIVQSGPFTYHIAWGDGSLENLTGLSSVTESHVFANPGSDIVNVTVTDSLGVNSVVSFLLPITIVFAQQQGENVLLAGTPGNDRFTLTRAASANQFFVSLNGVSAGKFTVGPSGQIQIDGQGGNDTVVVQGTSGVDAFAVTNTGINLDGESIDAPNVATFVLLGNGGNDTLSGLGVANTFRLTGRMSGNLNGTVRFAGIRNLSGGSGVDTFVVSKGASGFGTINGGGASDTLDFSALTLPFRVDLRNSSAFGVARFANVENLIGSSRTAATLTGPNAASTFVIDGRNTGTVAGLRFTQFSNLTGGAGNDRFEIAGTQGNPGAISGTIDGGGGLNVLDYSAFPVSGSTGVLVNFAAGTATGVRRVAGIRIVVGSSGDDTLTGGSQGAVLLGGPGNDRLQGGNGRDVLIGGSGSDTVLGGAGDDIVFGGTTTYYDEGTGSIDTASLGRILRVWGSVARYATRISTLTSGGSAALIGSKALFDDAGAVDRLFGQNGRDWFLTSPGDVVVGRQPGEALTNI